MKYICAALILIIVFGCNKNQGFLLNGTIYGDSPEYIYLIYDDKRDSTLVVNNRFRFKGKVDSYLLAHLSTGYISTLENPFYLENSNMSIQITIENKIYKNMDVSFIKVDNLKGSKTFAIQNDFENFRHHHRNDDDWNAKLFKKLSELIEQNPDNAYAGNLLAEISSDSFLEKNQIISLYNKLDLDSQSSDSMTFIKRLLIPKTKVSIKNKIIDFELPDQGYNMVSTKKFRGSLLLIDFWASWCVPCREQNIELTEIYKLFKNNGFNVLGVSVDRDRDKWLRAVKNDDLLWDNVIDLDGFEGDVSEIYDLSYSVPHNFLINKEGVVIAKDLKMEDLKEILEKLNNILSRRTDTSLWCL